LQVGIIQLRGQEKGKEGKEQGDKGMGRETKEGRDQIVSELPLRHFLKGSI